MEQANWLAVDVATPQGSIALKTAKGKPVLRMLDGTASDVMMSSLLELLSDQGITLQQVTHLACNQGPGGFTGLRVGASLMQGISLGLQRPLWGACSLESTAEAYCCHRVELGEERPAQAKVWVVLDARLDQVFWAQYEWKGDKWVCHQPPQLSDPETMILPDDLDDQWIAVGSGWALYPGLQERYAEYLSEVDPTVSCNAAAILLVAQRWASNGVAGQIGRVELNYLRNKVAQTVEERKIAKGFAARV
jgi:tRNA threonylcarbamoyladenosine biosynthesis protein TsaB